VDTFDHIAIAENDVHEVLEKLLGAVPGLGRAQLHDLEAGF
jgi:hypothetical protein